MIETKLIGFEALQKRLQKLPGNIAEKHLRSAVLAGAAVVRKDAQARAPKESGRLAKSIKAKFIKGNDRNEKRYGVCVMAPHAHLIELGTRPHFIKPKKKRALAFGGRGWVTGSSRAGSMVFEGYGTVVKEVFHPGNRANPFLRAALESNTSAIESAIHRRLSARLDREGV